MLPRNDPDRIQVTFDDHRLVADAGLILPTTLARHLGLPQLVQECLDLGDAPGRANTLVMGVREIDRSLEQWQMGVKDLRRRVILAPTPRERERWYAILPPPLTGWQDQPSIGHQAVVVKGDLDAVGVVIW